MIQIGRHQLHHGDALDVLRSMPDASVDAVVTDPPYGLGKEPDALAMLRDWMTTGYHAVGGAGFMGREWDAFVPQPVLWAEVLRVLKPGGHALVFAGTRTQDLMGLALRIAGFEVRDCLQWIYGSGFPKSLDVSKAIDKAAGATREVVGLAKGAGSTRTHSLGPYAATYESTRASTDAARQWDGWGTALKPAYEPVILARKPLIGTVAENVLAHGTGGINIEAARIETSDNLNGGAYSGSGERHGTSYTLGRKGGAEYVQPEGRWPANVALDEVAAELLDGQAGERTSGGASRFFYCAKASRSERGATNKHPTVKPLALMRWLCKLVTPPGGVILDPFAGSGTTLLAADALGFRCIAIEREADHVDIIRDRFEEAQQSAPLFAA